MEVVLPNDSAQAFISDAGFRPGSRDPFLSGKGSKTIDAPPVLLDWEDAKHGEAGQLAVLRQGPPID